MRSTFALLFAAGIGVTFFYLGWLRVLSLDSIQFVRTNRLFRPSIDGQDLGPVKKVGFLKTHKTASSTIQNIILRYGLNHNLTFVLPSSGNYLVGPGSRSDPFQAHWLQNVPWHRKLTSTHQYDVIALHTRWNYDQFKFLLGSKAVFFTILREPSEVFESLFSYVSFEEKLQVNISEYLQRSKDPKYRANRLGGFLGLNQQLWDLGVDLDISRDKKDIEWHIQRLSQQFDLVLITDRIDESLVLLAQLLRVPLSEMVSLKMNSRKKTAKLELSEADQKLLQDLQSGEIKLYRYFKERLLKQIQIFGQSKMKNQVEELKKLQLSAHNNCVLSEADKNSLKGTKFEPYHPDTIAYRVKEDNIDCVQMATAELHLIDMIREKMKAWWFRMVHQQRP
ncbi:galactosylceramide sulfotransferase-like isoform X2 [Tigriopus californicus]|nr:galactosylceramide sulfotransferase-like isoform X2 [Tigriopus californicus]